MLYGSTSNGGFLYFTIQDDQLLGAYEKVASCVDLSRNSTKRVINYRIKAVNLLLESVVGIDYD